MERGHLGEGQKRLLNVSHVKEANSADLLPCTTISRVKLRLSGKWKTISFLNMLLTHHLHLIVIILKHVSQDTFAWRVQPTKYHKMVKDTNAQLALNARHRPCCPVP